MSVKTITITGADDATNVADLVAISREFPHVEWGVLISESRRGTPRYPSEGWLRELRVARCGGIARDRVDGLDHRIRIAAHLCGRASRRLFAEGERAVILENYLTFFDRVQLNGYDFDINADPPPIFRVLHETPPSLALFTFILQARNDIDVERAALLAKQTNRVEVLYDPSGGTGTRVRAWPVPLPGLRLGYAGGIGPDNVGEVLAAVDIAIVFAAERDQETKSTWIDMESRVRTDDRLDLDKVRAVLAAHADYLKRRTIWKEGEKS